MTIYNAINNICYQIGVVPSEKLRRMILLALENHPGLFDQQILIGSIVDHLIFLKDTINMNIEKYIQVFIQILWHPKCNLPEKFKLIAIKSLRHRV